MVKLFLAVPTIGNVADSQVHMLRKIEKKYAGRIEFVYPEHCVQRVFHDFARNALVEDFLASGADIMWFLDSDVTPPEHVLDLITEHGDKWEAAGAPYPIFMAVENEQHRQVLFTVYRTNQSGGLGASSIPMQGTDWVDGMATGCIFLRRSLFEKLQKPYFQFKYAQDTDMRPIEGEDLGFCFKLRELGIKFFTDYSMACKHTKVMDLLEINNYAMVFAKKSIENYDRNMRPMIMEAAKALANQMLYEQQRKRTGLVIPGR